MKNFVNALLPLVILFGCSENSMKIEYLSGRSVTAFENRHPDGFEFDKEKYAALQEVRAGASSVSIEQLNEVLGPPDMEVVFSSKRKNATFKTHALSYVCEFDPVDGVMSALTFYFDSDGGYLYINGNGRFEKLNNELPADLGWIWMLR